MPAGTSGAVATKGAEGVSDIACLLLLRPGEEEDAAEATGDLALHAGGVCDRDGDDDNEEAEEEEETGDWAGRRRLRRAWRRSVASCLSASRSCSCSLRFIADSVRWSSTQVVAVALFVDAGPSRADDEDEDDDDDCGPPRPRLPLVFPPPLEFMAGWPCDV